MRHLLEICLLWLFTQRYENFIFVGEITWKVKWLLSQFNLFSVKDVGRVLLTSLNYWSSWTGSRIYYWTVVYLSRILRSSNFLSISPRVSHSEALKSMRKRFIIQSRKWNISRLSIVKVEHCNLRNGTNLLKQRIEQNFISTTLLIDKFQFLYSFWISRLQMAQGSLFWSYNRV
jgi:hypothetical protein